MTSAFTKQETKGKTLKVEVSFRISRQKTHHHILLVPSVGGDSSGAQNAETVRYSAAYPTMYGVPSDGLLFVTSVAHTCHLCYRLN